MIASRWPALPQALRRVWLGPVSGLLLLSVLLWPPVRRAMESGMTLHMLLQYPAVLAAGALLIGPVPRRWQRSLQRFNELGIAGLLLAAVTMAVLMVPRVLDLALVDLRVEALKLLALTLSGAAVRLSWQRAGTVVQAFFLGNVLPMLAVAGTLYLDSTTRLCNAYLMDDQQTLGAALPWVAAGVLAWWLLQLALLHFVRHDAPAAVRESDSHASVLTPRAVHETDPRGSRG